MRISDWSSDVCSSDLLPGKPGPNNAITDVPGVLVGYETLNSYEVPSIKTGQLPVLTGVTAILPRGFDTTPKPVWAGQFSLNGNGEMTGTHWVQDGGYFVGPEIGRGSLRERVWKYG